MVFAHSRAIRENEIPLDGCQGFQQFPGQDGGVIHLGSQQAAVMPLLEKGGPDQ
jgi:hypothetical protein